MRLSNVPNTLTDFGRYFATSKLRSDLGFSFAKMVRGKEQCQNSILVFFRETRCEDAEGPNMTCTEKCERFFKLR